MTGRLVADWTPALFHRQNPDLRFLAHGYKAGGANPPGAELLCFFCDGGENPNPIHPPTFKPEFIDAFEVGTKNTLLDGTLTLNGDIFYYNYEQYQISEIVDRSAINLNFDAHVKGAEVESTWEPIPGLRFNFAGGWEDTALAKGSQAVDLMDRTAGNPLWMVVRPFVTQASNCILPVYVVIAALQSGSGVSNTASRKCLRQRLRHPFGSPRRPVWSGYPGFDPVSPTATNNGAGPAPNNGEGFDKDLSGNKLAQCAAPDRIGGRAIHNADHGGLGGHAARGLLLAGLFVGARVQ